MNGNALTSTTLDQIRGFACTIYRDLDTNTQFPKRIEKWCRNASELQIAHFRAKMYAKWPLFQYCDDDWKLNVFVTRHYFSWARHHLNTSDIKREAEDLDDITDTQFDDVVEAAEASKHVASKAAPAPAAPASQGTVETVPATKRPITAVDANDTSNAKGAKHFKFKNPL